MVKNRFEWRAATNTAKIIEDLGNPFAEDGTDLFTLDTNAKMLDEVVHAVQTVKELRDTQHHDFVQESLADATKPSYDSGT